MEEERREAGFGVWRSVYGLVSVARGWDNGSTGPSGQGGQAQLRAHPEGRAKDVVGQAAAGTARHARLLSYPSFETHRSCGGVHRNTGSQRALVRRVLG